MNDIFSIFNPDWWMDENNNALQIADAVLFFCLSIPVVYLFIYAIASLIKYRNPYPMAKKQHRFLVLFTALRDGKEVINSINHFLDTQRYPRDKYEIAVAATQVPEEDLITLLKMPVNIVVPDKEECTKVYAIQQVMERYSPNEYDAIVIFNSDNLIVPEALTLFNNAYYSGCDAIQAHRMTENLTSKIAILDATTEEINNHLFRKAHTTLGFSSALIGSGMMFDFEMFHRIAPRLTGSDFTKTMEAELLKENIYTEYMEEIICYCKKREDASGYIKQRQSWSSATFHSKFYAFLHFPLAFLQGKWDLCDKLFQWALPSRLLLIAYITTGAVVLTLMEWPLSIKWYILLFILLISYLMALPEGEISKKFRKSFWALPTLIFTSAFGQLNILKPKNKKQGKEKNRLSEKTESKKIKNKEQIDNTEEPKSN